VRSESKVDPSKARRSQVIERKDEVQAPLKGGAKKSTWGNPCNPHRILPRREKLELQIGKEKTVEEKKKGRLGVRYWKD